MKNKNKKIELAKAKVGSLITLIKVINPCLDQCKKIKYKNIKKKKTQLLSDGSNQSILRNF